MLHTKGNIDWRKPYAVCLLHWLLCRTSVMRSYWLPSRWNMIRFLSSGTGAAEQLSCIMCSLVISTLAITQLIRPYFRIWWCGGSLSSRRIWAGWCPTSVLRIIWSWLWTCRRKKSLHWRIWCLIPTTISGFCLSTNKNMQISICCLMI